MNLFQYMSLFGAQGFIPWGILQGLFPGTWEFISYTPFIETIPIYAINQPLTVIF